MSKAKENVYLYTATGMILAVGFGAYSALTPFGSTLASIDRRLDHISGTLASIDKTLAPVDKSRTPYQNKLKDGCYQLFGSAVLDKPGCYVLQEDIRFEQKNDFLLNIKSSDVSVDLNRKTVTGPGQSSLQSGIYIETGDNIKIENGIIKDFMFGIRAEKGLDKKPLGFVVIENVVVVDASLIGIKVAARKVSLRQNEVVRLNSVDEKKYEYVLDFLIDARDCYYKGVKSNADLNAGAASSLIRLPDRCVIGK